MVGTRDRVPYGIGLSSEISAGILGRRGPRTRSYPLFLGIRFSRFPGRLSPPRPAASFRPRRKEIYYAHPLPWSRGFPAFFPGGGVSGACFPHMTWGDALLLPFGPRTHSLHKPRKDVRIRCGASRRARTGADQMFLSPTNQASPVPGRSEHLSGRIIRSEIRRRGRRITIYSSVMPRRDISRFIVAPLTIRRGRALLEHPAS